MFLLWVYHCNHVFFKLIGYIISTMNLSLPFINCMQNFASLMNTPFCVLVFNSWKTWELGFLFIWVYGVEPWALGLLIQSFLISCSYPYSMRVLNIVVWYTIACDFFLFTFGWKLILLIVWAILQYRSRLTHTLVNNYSSFCFLLFLFYFSFRCLFLMCLGVCERSLRWKHLGI